MAEVLEVDRTYTSGNIEIVDLEEQALSQIGSGLSLLLDSTVFARKQAEDAIAKAQKKCEEIVDRATQEAKQEGLERRQAAEKEFLNQKEKILVELKAKLSELEKEKSRAVPEAAGRIFSQLTNI